MLFRPRNRDPALFRDDANRLWKCALLHFHHKLENVAALPAPKAVINLLGRVHIERWCFFRMKRAQPAKILPSLFQLDVFPDDPDNVRLLLHLLRK